MHFCIVGLGAIGGLMAARLAHAGEQVSALARGATLAAVRRDGLEWIEDDEASGKEIRRRVPLTVAEDAGTLVAAAGTPDVLVIALKGTGLIEVARRIGPLIGPDTTILSAMNGVPWWFFSGRGADLERIRLTSLDPHGELASALPPRQVVGAVSHMSVTTPAPGQVRRMAGNRLIIGEPAGGCASARAQAIAGALRKAGYALEEAAVIQQEIWFKLWGNMTMNPISALTGATGDRILDDEYVRAFTTRCMLESAAIGEKIDLPIAADPEERLAVTRKLGAFRTSMLQDMEAGKPLELDALVAAVAEIGAQVGVPTPNIETLLGLARLKARVAGLYPPAGQS